MLLYIKIVQNKILDYEAEVFVFDVFINKNIRKGFRPKLAWLGASKVINSHSAGLIICKKVHNKIGFYSNIFELCSDSDFIIKCLKSNVKFKYVSILLGIFSVKGKSNKNYLKSIDENFRLMVNNNFSYSLQLVLLILRKIKFYFKF